MQNPKAKLAMRQAWAEARRGQTIYGGSVRQYFAEALRLAWADMKANPVLREVDRIIAQNRANRAAGRTSFAAPYGVRKFGNRSIARWQAGQGVSP